MEDAMQGMFANEFRKRIQNVDWRALDWGMKNNKDTGEMTFNITFPGSGAMAQKVLKKKTQPEEVVQEVEPGIAPTTEVAPIVPPVAASKKVEVKVAMTKEAAVKIVAEKYPKTFLESMGLV